MVAVTVQIFRAQVITPGLFSAKFLVIGKQKGLVVDMAAAQMCCQGRVTQHVIEARPNAMVTVCAARAMATGGFYRHVCSGASPV